MKKHLKIFIVLIFIAFASIVVCPMHAKADNRVLTFNDKNMYAAMKSQLRDKIISSDDSNQSITMSDESIENTRYIYISKKDIVDLSGIENFTNLESLDISGNNVTSIEKIPGENLRSLSLSRIEIIQDLQCIESYKKLYNVDVEDSNLEEIPDSLKKIANQISYFEWSNGVLKTTAWVKDFTRLTSLELKNNKISSLENIALLTNLTSADLSGNQIENIDEFSSCTNLYSLYLNDNNITNLNGISGLCLSTLHVANNKITDISAINLSKLSYLDVSNNCIVDFDNIKDFAVDKEFKIYGQLIRIDVNSGDKVSIPAMVNQSKNFFEATNIETLNCKIDDKGKCEIDESVTYARIKINDGIMKDSMVYFNVTNVQAPGVTDKTINFTKTHIVVVCEVLFIMVISVFIIANIKNKKSKNSSNNSKNQKSDNCKVDNKKDNSKKTKNDK